MDLIATLIAGGVIVAAGAAGTVLFRRWRRQRYQFTLKALLLAFAITAVLLCTLEFVLPAVKHRWAVYNIDHYAQIVFDGDAKQGEDWFETSRKSFSRWRDVDNVDVSNDASAIDVARELRNLPEVKQVSFGGRVTDAGLKAICELTQHPSLESLQFLESPITSAGFSQVAKLQQLKSVFINTCPIGDMDLSSLKSLKHLQMLGLVEEGKRAKSIRFSEAGFATIGELNELTWLRLVRLQISDAAASHLNGLAHLKKLHFSGCQISDQAVESLRQALPECDITNFKPSPPAARSK